MLKNIFFFFLFVTFFFFFQCDNDIKEKENSSSSQQIIEENKWDIELTTNNNKILITGNGFPEHPTGDFPNAANPHTIQKQNVNYEIPLSPKSNNTITGLSTDMASALLRDSFAGAKISYKFGISTGGIVFDPVANAFGGGDAKGGGEHANKRWRYEAVNDQVSLGLDFNHAHVQPDGTYHYHGYPLAEITNQKNENKVVLIGFAADGFPIYNQYSYQDPNDMSSIVIKLSSSYSLKSGKRNLAGNFSISYPYPNQYRALGKSYNPDQNHDGTYIRDYKYVSGSGDLDQYNGRYGKTPEYPNGTYYYVITDHFPYIPRFFRGTPDDSFKIGSK